MEETELRAHTEMATSQEEIGLSAESFWEKLKTSEEKPGPKYRENTHTSVAIVAYFPYSPPTVTQC